MIFLIFLLLCYYYISADPIMYTCDLIKLTVLGYYCSLMGSFAIDRYFATHYWRWYERGSLSTLLVLAGAESAMILPNVLVGVLNLEGTLYFNYSLFLFMLLQSQNTQAFIRTYRINVRLRQEIARGASVGSYSISKTFQVNENVVVME
ncbi:hypothetical protein PFISCL1PPCAC_12877, partial [Pristionchus fissidentatus]